MSLFERKTIFIARKIDKIRFVNRLRFSREFRQTKFYYARVHREKNQRKISIDSILASPNDKKTL